ncbi:MAG: hypothetical protein CMK65_13230 [Pseudoalteromonas sp.]|uniref:hypothetical protein n=1 Tax=Pseudoalteromonas sp. TaxID=53249 RepID=UPI000C9700FC|nr:hypothetical protein [Pseudoalteromonas sp.]MAD04567.1 hypothetical protein [Pseudoalteromonas sp.]|tara:strand:- start:562 stop:1014 length:453 start_codon:yes stop_codon:yes gene_type:complete
MNKELKDIAVKLRNEIKKQIINEDKVQFFFENYQSNFQTHLQEELNDHIPLDSYRVEVAYYFLEGLEESQDIDIANNSVEPDIYNADLLSWLSSNFCRSDYVNQILEESDIQDCFNLLRLAQYREIEEVTQAVINYIESELEQGLEVEYE